MTQTDLEIELRKLFGHTTKLGGSFTIHPDGTATSVPADGPDISNMINVDAFMNQAMSLIKQHIEYELDEFARSQAYMQGD